MHIQNLNKFCERVLKILSGNSKIMTNERKVSPESKFTMSHNAIRYGGNGVADQSLQTDNILYSRTLKDICG